MNEEQDFKKLSDTDLKKIYIGEGNGEINDPSSLASKAFYEHQRRKENENKEKLELQQKQIVILEDAVTELSKKFDKIITLLTNITEKPGKSFIIALVFAVLTGVLINLFTELIGSLLSKL